MSPQLTLLRFRQRSSVNDEYNIVSLKQIYHLNVAPGAGLASDQDFVVVNASRLWTGRGIHHVLGLLRVHTMRFAHLCVPSDPPERISHELSMHEIPFGVHYFFPGFSGISAGMDRRESYKLVAELLPRAGGPEALLNAVADRMRGRRDPGNLIGDDLRSLCNGDDALGQVYQAINAPALEAAYRATARDRRKFAASEIPAVTQLFTPKWVVEYLLQNTLGKLWMEIHPDTRLRKSWKWLVESPLHSSPLRHAGDLRICDPACGTMNFGLVALDMLREIYREEIVRAGKTDWPERPSCSAENEIDVCIIQHNLIGFDIDRLAIDLARRSLEIKIGKPIRDGKHRLCVCDALFDKRIGGEFDVVVTNPPYLSARNLDPAVVRRLKSRYPAGWRDLYACFTLKALEMLRPGGRAGILSMQSFMFTAAFERMRRKIAEQAQVQAVAHFGPGLFDIGNPGTLQTAAVVFQRKPAADCPGIFYRLVDAKEKRAALAGAIRTSDHFKLSQDDLASLPRSAWMYWISPAVRRAFRDLPRLGEIAPPRQGLATTDNVRFVRYWWEVEPPGFAGAREKWMPYAKGGRFRRWYESARHRVNWENDGREIKASIVERYPYLDGQWQWVAKNSGWYGREGITYSYLTSGSFSARRLEAGTIFDVAGSSLFPDDPLAMLGLLNSALAGRLLSAINPTVNFQVGDLRQLPVPRSFPDELRQASARAIEWTRRLDCFDETSVDFVRPEPWNDEGARVEGMRSSIDSAQERIDRIVAELYGMKEPKQKRSKTRGIKAAKDQTARRWIGYALGVWLGRWEQSAAGEVAVLSPLDENLRRDLRRILADRAGGKRAAEMEAAVGGLDRFFARDFLSWHNSLYRSRPVFWGFTGNGRTVAVSRLNADLNVMRSAFARIGQTLPDGWGHWPDDGIQINLSPLAPWIADPKLRQVLTHVAADLRRGRFTFSETSRRMMGKLTRESSDEFARRGRPNRNRIPLSSRSH
jgi:hypothetical protein